MKSILDAAMEKHEDVMKYKQMIEKKQESGEMKPTPVSPDDEELKKLAESLKISIKVIGCGGGGSNTITRMYDEGITGAEMCAINTDAPHLLHVHSPKKILIGKHLTKGLGAGAIPQTGAEAAKEGEQEIRNFIDKAHIVFVTAGMGGGTGTGAAPVVAKIAKESGALVMGVVTLPFSGEGKARMENAMWGLQQLVRYCDTTITIPNDKLLELVPKLPIDKAFRVADEILAQTIRGITEIVTKPGLVNLDYSDIQTIMKDGGVAMVGIGESDSDRNRIEEAVQAALHCPLLGKLSLSEAKGAMVRVVGGDDLTIAEAEKAAEIVTSSVSPNARVIWGCSIDHELEKTVQILLILTGVKSEYLKGKDSIVIESGKRAGIDMVR
jgi:cell division protein FtsZ